MYRHILAPTDGSEVGQRGVDEALALAKAIGAQVTIITVTERLPVYPEGLGLANPISGATVVEFAEGQERAATAMLNAAKAAAERAGVSAETLLIRDALPDEAIIEAAKSRSCDLIVIASHGRRGLGRLFLGSKTAAVVAHSPVPVLVVR